MDKRHCVFSPPIQHWHPIDGFSFAVLFVASRILDVLGILSGMSESRNEILGKVRAVVAMPQNGLEIVAKTSGIVQVGCSILTRIPSIFRKSFPPFPPTSERLARRCDGHFCRFVQFGFVFRMLSISRISSKHLSCRIPSIRTERQASNAGHDIGLRRCHRNQPAVAEHLQKNPWHPRPPTGQVIRAERRGENGNEI